MSLGNYYRPRRPLSPWPRRIALALFIALTAVAVLLLVGCWTTKSKPIPQVVVAPMGAATTSQIAALEAQVKQQTELAQRAAGAVYGGRDANQSNPEGLPREAVSTHLDVAASALPEPTAEQRLAATADNVRMLAGELLAVKAEKGLAITENQRLRAELAASEQKSVEVAAAAARERAESAVRFQAQMDELTRRIADEQARAAAAEDKARKESLALLGKVILGLGTALLLGGAAIAFVTKGKEWERAAIVAGFGCLCFGLHWTLNQWWFKWAVIASMVAAVAAGAWWLMRERKVAVRQVEADEAEDTLKRIISVVDELGEAATVADVRSGLGRAMSDNHKALLHELRAENKRMPVAGA